jgi:hypothetical protein
MQPGQLLSDLRWLMGRLGARSRARGVPVERAHRRGARVILGSDWPIEPLDPLRGLYGATAPLREEEAAASAAGDPRRRATAPGGGARRGDARPRLGGRSRKASRDRSKRPAGSRTWSSCRGDPDARALPRRSPSVTIDYTIFDGKVVHGREESEVAT